MPSLDEFKNSSESYDETIKKIISEIKGKNIKRELIECYSNIGKKDLEILKEWEVASGDLDG